MQSRRSHSLGQVAAALGLAVAAASAHAAAVNHADVGGIRTFQDTLTGGIWADLDSFRVPNLGNGGCACHAYASYGAARPMSVVALDGPLTDPGACGGAGFCV